MQGIFEISIPEKYVISIPDMEGNETNADFTPMLDKYCNNILKRGWKVWNGGPALHAEIHSLVVQEFLLILGFEGSIKYYNPFVKVEKVAINDEISEGLPNKTHTVVIDDSDPENIITEERIRT